MVGAVGERRHWETRDGVSEPNLIGSIWGHKLLIGSCVALFAAVGLLIATSRPSVYLSEAGLLLEDPRSTALAEVRPVKDQLRYAADQVAILKSQAVALRASIAAGKRKPPVLITPDEVRRNMTVRSSETSNYVTIGIRAPHKTTAQVAANAVVDAYRAVVSASVDADIRASIARLDAAIGTAVARLNELTTGRAPAAQVRDTRAYLDILRGRRSSVLADAQLMGDGVGLATRAEPGKLQGISLKTALAVAIVLGGLLGAGLAYWLDARRQAFSSRFGPESLLDAPALAEIPDFAREDIASDLPVLDAPGTEAAEAFRFLAFGIGLPRTWSDGDRVADEDDSWKDNFPGLTDRELSVLDLVARGLSSNDVATTLPGLTRAKVDHTIRSILDKLDETDRDSLVLRVQAAGRSRRRDLGGDASRLVAFVASTHGDGTTTMAANTAVAAAQEGQRVLLVDADIENGGLTRRLLNPEDLAPRRKGSRPVGLTDIIMHGLPVERLPALIETAAGGSVTVLSAGKAVADPMRLFRTEQLSMAFDSLRSQFDLIFVDVPPLLQVAYAGALLRVARAVVVIVPHASETSALKHTRERLDLLEVRPIGYVYNVLPLRRSRSPRWLPTQIGGGKVGRERHSEPAPVNPATVETILAGRRRAEAAAGALAPPETGRAAVVRQISAPPVRTSRAWVERGNQDHESPASP